MKDLNTRIKKLRQEKGWTTYDVADKLGFASQGSYHKIEAGKTKITIDKLESIAKLYGVSVANLLGFDSQDNSELERQVQNITLQKEKLEYALYDILLVLLDTIGLTEKIFRLFLKSVEGTFEQTNLTEEEVRDKNVFGTEKGWKINEIFSQGYFKIFREELKKAPVIRNLLDRRIVHVLDVHNMIIRSFFSREHSIDNKAIRLGWFSIVYSIDMDVAKIIKQQDKTGGGYIYDPNP